MDVQITHNIDISDIAEALSFAPEEVMRRIGRELIDSMLFECSYQNIRAFVDGVNDAWREAEVDQDDSPTETIAPSHNAGEGNG